MFSLEKYHYWVIYIILRLMYKKYRVIDAVSF